MTPQAGFPDEPRFILPLDAADWRWTEGRYRSLSGGRPVRLPHCWNAAEEYRPGVQPRRGWATYQLDFELPRMAPDREWRLRSDGFYGVGRAWLNGGFLGNFNGDYLGLDLAASEVLRTGGNRLEIQVGNRWSRDILPGLPDPDFHLYGGLGGGMHLIGLPRVRVQRQASQVVMDPSCPGKLTVVIGLTNRGASRAVPAVRITIRNPAGEVVAMPEPQSIALPPGGQARQEVRCSISSPQLWCVENPCLYSVEAALHLGPERVDRVIWNFGIRTAQFDPKQGFTLNGQPVILRGVNRHENLPGFGFALPRALHAADARQIKQLGLNFVRLSHYPQSPAFLDACDRLGLLVYAEVCSWKQVNRGRWLAAAQRQLERMIRRDRHHPSIILWGLGNEGRDRQAYGLLKKTVRELDPSRPTIYAENHAYRARRQKTAGLTDVWGLNYELEELDFARSSAPTGCVVVSECANLPCARRGHGPAEAQQVALIRDAVQRVEAAGPGATGWTLWSFADYATPRRRRWFRECGVVDGWRTGKMAADWLRARYQPEPFLSVRGDWSFAAGNRRRLYILTNCREVEIRHATGTRTCLPTPLPDLYETDVIFDHGPVQLVGRHPGGVVEAWLVPWGAAAAFSVQADAVASGLFRCTLQVADRAGTPVLGYEGDAMMRMPPGVRASLVGGASLPVHAGRAAFFAEQFPGATEVRIECTLEDFPAQWLVLPGAGEAP